MMRYVNGRVYFTYFTLSLNLNFKTIKHQICLQALSTALKNGKKIPGLSKQSGHQAAIANETGYGMVLV